MNDCRMSESPTTMYATKYIALQTRVDVIVDLISGNGGYISTETLLRCLGTEKAVAYADKLKAKYAESVANDEVDRK